MTRWKVGFAGVTLMALGVLGCKQTLYTFPDDHAEILRTGLPKHYETNPHGPIAPPPRVESPTPATVLDPDREKRPITLQEAIAIALRQGNLGTSQLIGGGGGVRYSDNLANFSIAGAQAIDSIRAFSLDPAIAGAEIERALSKFDARWISSMTWTKRDDAVTNLLQNFQNGDQAQLSTALLKPLPTGGVAGITFSTDYTFLSAPPSQQFQVVNPAYRPRLQVSFEQPLLQGFGVEINQLRRIHPGSVRTNLQPSGNAQEGILLSRLRYDQSLMQFESRVQFMLVDVEAAYWNLRQAYESKTAFEEALKRSFRNFQIVEDRVAAGRDPIQSLARAAASFYRLKDRRNRAVAQVLEAERQLRGLLNLPSDDNTRLVPIDQPTKAPYQPDWLAALNETLQQRPELLLARQEVKARQLDLILQKNSLLPDLRFFADYDINGIGTQLDGSEATGSALSSLANNDFNSWNLGLRLEMPIGFRDAHAAVRTAKLNLARSYHILQNQEEKAARFLERTYRELFTLYESMKNLQAEREWVGRELKAREDIVRVGRGEGQTSPQEFLTQAQEQFADTVDREAQAIRDYNIALANFQLAKGAILEYNNVSIMDGPLPDFALVDAAEHLEQRTRALILRERASPTPAGEGPYCDIETLLDSEESVPENLPIPPTELPPDTPEMPSPTAPYPTSAPSASEAIPTMKPAAPRLPNFGPGPNTTNLPLQAPGSIPPPPPGLLNRR